MTCTKARAGSRQLKNGENLADLLICIAAMAPYDGRYPATGRRSHRNPVAASEKPEGILAGSAASSDNVEREQVQR